MRPTKIYRFNYIRISEINTIFSANIYLKKSICKNIVDYSTKIMTQKRRFKVEYILLNFNIILLNYNS